MQHALNRGTFEIDPRSDRTNRRRTVRLLGPMDAAGPAPSLADHKGHNGSASDIPDTSLPLSLATARGIALCESTQSGRADDGSPVQASINLTLHTMSPGQFILLLLSMVFTVLAVAALRRLAPALTHPTRCMLTVAVTTGVGVLASLALAVKAVWRVGQGRVAVEGAWHCMGWAATITQQGLPDLLT